MRGHGRNSLSSDHLKGTHINLPILYFVYQEL